MSGPPPVPPPLSPAPFTGPPEPPDGDGAAPRVRRLTAWGIDTALLWGAAVLLAMLTWARLHGYVVEDLPRKALSATGGLLLSGGDVEKAATDFGTGVWATFVGDVEQALVLLIAVQALYQFAGHAWLGRTLGKAAMDLRVRGADGEAAGKACAFRRALVTTAGGTGLYCLAWILLLESRFVLALATWMLSVGVFAANSLPALFGGRRRTLADLLAGTAVVRARTYERAVAAARQGAERAWDGAQAAGQVAWDGAQAAGQVTREGAQAAGQVAWDGAQTAGQIAWDGAQAAGQVAREQAARIAQSDHVRRAVESERAQRVRGMGRRLGGRIKDAYQERAAGRSPREAPPFPDPNAAPARADAPRLPDPDAAPAEEEASRLPDPGPAAALPPPRPRYDPLQGTYGQEAPYVPPQEHEHRHEPPMTP